MTRVLPYRIEWRPNLTTGWGLIGTADTPVEADTLATKTLGDFRGQVRCIRQQVLAESRLGHGWPSVLSEPASDPPGGDAGIPPRTRLILQEVGAERLRQLTLKAEGRFTYTPDEPDYPLALAMLLEEVGEVSRCVLAIGGDVQESLTPADMRKELIQVCAVAEAMIEGIDRRENGI